MKGNEEKDNKESGEKGVVTHLAAIGSMGFSAGMALAVCVVGGYYLDEWTGKYPAFTIVGILSGVFSSLFVLIKMAIDASRK